MQCRKCGTLNTEALKFCESCGTSFSSTPKVSFCEECGSKLEGGDRFCTGCGTPVSNVEIAGLVMPPADTVEVTRAPLANSATVARLASQATKAESEDQSESNEKHQSLPKSTVWIFLLVILAVVSSVVIWLVLKSPSKLDSKDTLTKERRSAQTGKSAGTAVRTKRDQEEQFSTALRLVDASTRNDHNKFEEVLKIIGDYPKVAVGDRKFGRELNAQGLLALKAKNIASAVELFSKALAADPSDVEVGDNLGYALCLSGAFANAESQLLNVLILAPQRVTAWANLAEASSHQGKDDQAVGAYVTAYKLSRKPEIFLESLKKHAEDPEYESTRDNLMQAIQKIEARN